MIAVPLILALAVAILLLPMVSDLTSAAKVLLGPDRRSRPAPAELPHLLFLVPAHNEELLIESCLRSLRCLRYPVERFAVVVIADNCTDRTAAIARATGVRCLERTEPERPGKPGALAWAVARLPLPEYDAVLIVDADTTVDPGFASALASAAPLRDKVLQPYNDVANRSDNALTRMAGVLATETCLAFRLKRRAGLNVPVSAGMCIGTGVLATHGWNAFSLSEDWEIYASLTAAGVLIDYVEAAHLYAQEARSLHQSATQRQRWTAGKVAVLRHTSPGLLRSRRIALSQKLDALAELSAPGPAVHLGVVAACCALTWLVPAPGATLLTLALTASLLRPATYTVIALGSDPEPWRALAAFSFLPLYTPWRLWTLLGSLRMMGNKPWVRTERHVPRRAVTDAHDL